MRYYVLDAAGEPLRIRDVIAWGTWLEDAIRDPARPLILAEATLTDATVITGFTGIDRDWIAALADDTRPPVLWVTSVLGGRLDDTVQTYTSRQAALAGHAHMVARVIAARRVLR